MSLTPYFFNRGFGPSSYWDPFPSTFDELFDPFALTTPTTSLIGGGGGSTALSHPIHELEQMATSPVMDVRDQGDKFQVLCKPPPNFNQNDLHVRVDRNILSVSGQREEREERGAATRQSRRSFTRLIRLPESVDQSQIAAKWTTEGLNIQLPKKAGALESGRRIQIEGVSGQGTESSIGGEKLSIGGGGGSMFGAQKGTTEGMQQQQQEKGSAYQA